MVSQFRLHCGGRSPAVDMLEEALVIIITFEDQIAFNFHASK